jgi:hypothetical protein
VGYYLFLKEFNREPHDIEDWFDGMAVLNVLAETRALPPRG